MNISELELIVRAATHGLYSAAVERLDKMEGLIVDEIVESAATALAIAKLAVHGGESSCAAVWSAMLRAGTKVPRGVSGPDRVTAAIFSAALDRCWAAGRIGQLEAAVSSFSIAVDLPHASEARQRKLFEAFEQRLSRAKHFQEMVLARHARSTLAHLLTRERRHHLITVVGSVGEFRSIDSMLTSAAISHGYPTLAENMLKAVMKCARWPITACLSGVTEMVYGDVLNTWFGDPRLRAGFTDAGNEWIRIAVCLTGDDLAGEPCDPDD